MWQVNQEQLNRSLQQFVETVLEQQNRFNYETTAIAFDSGFLYEQEWYKRGVCAKTRDLLRVDEWKPEQIGRGHLLEAVNNCMNQAIYGGKQSLVNWRDCAYIRSQFQEKTEESERVIYQIFKASDEEEEKAAFEAAMEVWGINYPAITFLYFLRDPASCIPMRPMLFARSFKRIGVETECTRQCTWENYREFLEIMKWIQYYLVKHFDDTAILLDAHTFVGMMNDVPDEDPTEDSLDILRSSYLDSVVVTGKKGERRKEYFITRYESIPRNREDAIAAHGFQCMACGMSFTKTYGSIGRNFIEVHHIVPLTSPDQEVEINPQTDLVCLCANCHRIIHRRKNAIMSVEELQQWLTWGAALNL